MLHVVNGDATAARLAPAALPGELLVWRDILVEGPADVGASIDALAERRAPWLARRFGIPADEYVANGRMQRAGLVRAVAEDEIVLWFEQDLFCAANLGYVAAWVERARPRARVSLVFPADPLGAAAPAALTALFAARRALSPSDVARAASWWHAYAASVPPPHVTAGDGDLAFLDRAWRLHLARFPSVATGLGVVETAALAAAGDGVRTFGDVFRATSADPRMRAHGLSDVQLAAVLLALADGLAPLVRIRIPGMAADSAGTLSAQAITTWTVSVTDDGRAVRDGLRDRLDAQALDWWLGGVRLEGRHVRWRWDDERERLTEGSSQA